MRRIAIGKIDSAERRNIDPFICLAKTENVNGCSIPSMTVYEHSIVTGYTARCLKDTFPYLCNIGLLDENSILIAALHDVGKVSPSFQRKIINSISSPDKKNELLHKLHLEENYEDIPHAEISAAAIYSIEGKACSTIAGLHHGGLSSIVGRSIDGRYGGLDWQAAREILIRRIKDSFNGNIPSHFKWSLINFLAGFTVISDWISSSISSSDFKSNPFVAIENAVREAGFQSHKYKKHLEFKDVFGFDCHPEQDAAISSYAGPGIYIIEAEMGSGKTEAAFYLCYKLLSDNFADGIYFALPTTITSRNMYSRFASFVNTILDGESISPKLIYSGFVLEFFGEGEPGKSWFDTKKRALLAPFGVGTIDQALMSVLNVRHSSVRAFGLAGKAVILDEVHSYDDYTGSLILDFVSMLEELGATVIILSATLRQETKRRLLGLDSKVRLSNQYPCITSKICSKVDETVITPLRHRNVMIKHETDDLVAIEIAIDAALHGSYVLWIENDVASAQHIYMILSSRIDRTNAGIGLIHSRFTGTDRIGYETEFVEMFGKNGIPNRGNNGFILVGTQVLEQSLDIDADILFTRIAPIDMIFQRIGRLWRHNIPERNGVPCVHILHPESASVPDADRPFGISGAVYSSYVLYKTLIAIENLASISLPDDIRRIIEDVYSDYSEERLPKNIAVERKKLIDNREKLHSLAKNAESRLGKVLSDDISTRYESVATRDILLLRTLDSECRKCILLDGTELDLFPSLSKTEKCRIASALIESMVSCPETKLASIDCLDTSAVDLFRQFIYIPDDQSKWPLILICDSSGRLYDISGNHIEQMRYSHELGLIFDDNHIYS